MPSTFTTNYGLEKPEEHAGLTGPSYAPALNGDLDIIDTELKARDDAQAAHAAAAADVHDAAAISYAGGSGMSATDVEAAIDELATEKANLTDLAPVPAGAITMFGGAAAPTGYLLCDGTSYVRASFAALFAAIGTAYGSADGTHFNVPDLRQRFPLGKAASGTGATLGGTGGAIDHPHTSADHAHGNGTLATGKPINPSTDRQVGTGAANASDAEHDHAVTGTVGSTTPGNTGANNPPFQAVNFIIKT